MPPIPAFLDTVGDLVLVGTALTPASDDVVRTAARLAELLDARLHLAHFLPVPELPADLREEAVTARPRSLSEEEGERDAVERLLEQVERVGLETSRLAGTTVAVGPAHRLLAQMAESLAADVVVVGAHERGEGAAELRARLPGSTADRVVRSGVAPVLVVRDGLELPPRHVLLAVDLSPPSEHAFAAGLDLLARIGARSVEALFVVSPFQGRVADEQMDYDTALDTARRELERMCEFHGYELPEAPRAAVRRGFPRQRILEEAQRTGADLVMVGSHGRSGYERFLLGSVAEEILRDAPVSVLVLPARDPDDPEDGS